MTIVSDLPDALPWEVRREHLRIDGSGYDRDGIERELLLRLTAGIAVAARAAERMAPCRACLNCGSDYIRRRGSVWYIKSGSRPIHYCPHCGDSL